MDIDAVGAAGQDINILNTGGSLVMSATESAIDAIDINATAGGIDIRASGAAAGEDIDITATGSSVNITATEAITTAIVLNASTAAGGIDITSNEDIDITTTGAAGEDITITNTGGSVNISATEDDTAAIVISTTAGGIDISATGVAADDLDISGVLTSVNISSTEAVDDSIVISATGTAGGIDITSLGDIDITTTGAAGEDITITNTGGSIAISATENVSSVIAITSNGGTSETIVITNTLGTGAGAISLIASAGGITLTPVSTGVVTVTIGDVSLTDGRLVMGTEGLTCSSGLVIDLATTAKGIITTTGETNTACAISFTNGVAGEFVVLSHDYNGTGVITFADVTGFDASFTPVTALCTGVDAGVTAANNDHFYLSGVMTSATEIMILGCTYFNAA